MVNYTPLHETLPGSLSYILTSWILTVNFPKDIVQAMPFFFMSIFLKS